MAASSDCGCSEAQPRIHPEEDKEWCIVNFYHLAALPNPEEVCFALLQAPMCREAHVPGRVTYIHPVLQIIPSFCVCLCPRGPLCCAPYLSSSPVQLVESHRSWFKEQGPEVLGRIYFSHQGVNAQFGGPKAQALAYTQHLQKHPLFRVRPALWKIPCSCHKG